MRASLESILPYACNYLGLDNVSDSMLSLLPEHLRVCRTTYSGAPESWTYSFGVPYHGQWHSGAAGTNTQFPVLRLVLVLNFAMTRQPLEEVKAFAIRLAQPDKHEDWLYEYVPVLGCPAQAKLKYEPTGTGDLISSLDWRVMSESGVDYLIEAKNRSGLMAEYIDQVARAGRSVVPNIPVERFFSGVLKKFGNVSPGPSIQGLFIDPQIKLDRAELSSYFSRIWSSIHFVALVSWSREAYVLTRPDVDVRDILGFFRLRASESLITTYKARS